MFFERHTIILAVAAATCLSSCRKDAAITPSPDNDLELTFGGPLDDFGKAVIETDEGDIVIAGITNSFGHGGADVYLIKTDASGKLLWERTYGGTGADGANSLVECPDGGYLIIGATTSYGSGLNDFYLVRTDADGNMLWSQAYGGAADDIGIGIAATTDGNYLITGMTSSFGAGADDMYLLKIDPHGTILWRKTYGGGSGEWAYTVKEIAGGYYLFGHTETYGKGDRDFYLVKTNTSGDTLWTRTYGGSGYEQSSTLSLTPDGNLLLCGHTASFGHPEHNLYAVKTDRNGVQLWENNYGGIHHDGGECAIACSDGTLLMAGRSMSFSHNDENVYLVQTDVSGNMITQRSLGGHADDAGYGVCETSKGYIVAGNSRSYGGGMNDVYLLRIDK